MTNVQLWQPKSAQNVSVESTSRSRSATREPNQSHPIFLHFCYPALLLSTQHSHTAGSIRAAAATADDNNKQLCCVCVCVCVRTFLQIEFSSPVCRAAVQYLTSDPTYRCVCACMCIMRCTSAALFSPESYHLLPAQSHTLTNITLTYMLICGVSVCLCEV